MELRTYPRTYLPADLDPVDTEALAGVLRELEERPVADRAALERWMRDWQEVSAAAGERQARAYVAMTRDTSDQQAKADYIGMLENMVPLLASAEFKLQRKLLASPAVGELDPAYYGPFLRQIRADVEIFREENVALLMDDEKLGQEYQELIGAERVEFRGESYTPEGIAPFLEEQDRATREEAWRARAAVKLADVGAVNDIYTRMIELRQRIAHNAGLPDYRAYAWLAKKRFDYTPEDTLALHDAIARYVVPLAQRDADQRKRMLGVTTLRPWDSEVDPEGRAPLRPFGSVDELIAGSRRVFHRLDPQLGDFFDYMADHDLLDLGNRPGKAGGGYKITWYEQRLPFIFMNAVGVKRDVETVLHESGHSFNDFLARDIDLFPYREPGMEFAEVASMSMELLARDALDEFYAPEDLQRVHSLQLRYIVRLLASLAPIDAFQHWVYTTADPSPEARAAKWAELAARFQPWIDWSGLEAYRDLGWQILHTLVVPFYVIEYAIAQLAALRIWHNSLADHAAALGAYKNALSLGGSKTLPELFAAAGARFSLDDATVREIMAATEERMDLE